MKNTRLSHIIMLLVAIVLWQCNPNKTASNVQKTIDSVKTSSKTADEFQSNFDSIQKGIPVYYNMYLSVDMSKLFKVEGSVFNASYLNPVGNVSSYLLGGKKALNLGIYAVDLSYLRAYDQLEKSRAYFDAMRKISGDLGIPDDFVLKMSDRFDKNMNRKDSLLKLANEIYRTTDIYLRKNDRSSASMLIILGGWTEALYLSSKITEEVPSNTELISKIADQKSSLDDLLAMLKESKNDKEIADYIIALDALKVSFDKFVFDEKNPKTSSKQYQEIVGKINHLRFRIIS
jgi:hypothetical protein